MRPNEEPALCVSIHDVSPHTWELCKVLVSALEQSAQVPLTLLVVPHYHRLPFADTGVYRQWLDQRLEKGDELALHGYSHLDEGPSPFNWRERFLRRVYTLSEGEFSAVDMGEARRRLEMGWEWFERHGWRPRGFVAPAWMMSAGTWNALRDFPFVYTTTMRRFHLLHERQDIYAPSLVYAARNPQGRLFSMAANSLLSHALAGVPLARVSLHPSDARHPRLVAHSLGLIERLARSRAALTKSAFADRRLAAIAACYAAS